MKKEFRWNVFRVVIILQLLFSFLLAASIVVQLFRNPPKSDIIWVIIAWLAILVILACLALLHIHIMNRYYPDRLIPGALITIRSILSVLSWIAVVILALAFGTIIIQNGAWQKLNLMLRLVTIVLLFLTIVSFIGLILQPGLINYIRKNHQRSLSETINQIGEIADGDRSIN